MKKKDIAAAAFCSTSSTILRDFPQMIKLLQQIKVEQSIDSIVLQQNIQIKATYELRDGIHSGGFFSTKPFQYHFSQEPILHLECQENKVLAAGRKGNLIMLNLDTQKLHSMNLSQSPLLYCSSLAGIKSAVNSVGQLISIQDQFQQYRDKVSQFSLWCCRSLDKNSVFCGGDQQHLIRIDMRQRLKEKFKTASGICDIKLFGGELHVGTFSGLLYNYDIRKLDVPLVQRDCQGGVWRIIQGPAKDLYMLAIYDKHFFQIVRKEQSLYKSIDKLPHDSLAYACAWHRQQIVTSSFYDHVLKRWHLALKF